MVGAALVPLNKLIVITICGINLHYKCMGKVGTTPANVARV